uniref:Uncharacterized protein n=1 Tax=Oryza punctata TaxID=4537 RepID=A0A0E0LAZ1_ORYPU
MARHTQFTQMELRNGLVLLPIRYTPSRVARASRRKKTGKAARVVAGTSHGGAPSASAVQAVVEQDVVVDVVVDVEPATAPPASQASLSPPATGSGQYFLPTFPTDSSGGAGAETVVWAEAGAGEAVTRFRHPVLEPEEGLHVAAEPASGAGLQVGFGVPIAAVTAGGDEGGGGGDCVQNAGNGGGEYGNPGSGRNDAG